MEILNAYQYHNQKYSDDDDGVIVPRVDVRVREPHAVPAASNLIRPLKSDSCP